MAEAILIPSPFASGEVHKNYYDYSTSITFYITTNAIRSNPLSIPCSDYSTVSNIQITSGSAGKFTAPNGSDTYWDFRTVNSWQDVRISGATETISDSRNNFTIQRPDSLPKTFSIAAVTFSSTYRLSATTLSVSISYDLDDYQDCVTTLPTGRISMRFNY